MAENKISFGVRFKKSLIERLDKIISNSPELNTTRSELLEAITEAFFSSKFDSFEKGREFIITKRKRENLFRA